MKGGTTSGVVYPPAIALLGDKYRLRSVGGSSAGAIAAAVAAAAEYRRQTSDMRDDMSGFNEVAALSEELGKDLTRYLQPSGDMAPLFDLMIELMELQQKEKKPNRLQIFRKIIWPKLKNYRGKATQNGSIIAGASVVAGFAGLGFGLGALGVAAGGIWFVAQTAYSVLTGVQAQLVKNDFGMVPGTTRKETKYGHSPAISDWLAEKIDRIAGLWEDGPPSKPLTAGDLKNGRTQAPGSKIDVPGIAFAAMTTDLTSQRPFSLPLQMPDLFFFNPEELEMVIPKRVVDFMVDVANGEKVSGPDGKSLVPIPVGDDFPVVLMARMSLSFPFLLQTVPLYRRYTNASEKVSWERCLFSDGGISSNLPVHFFDAWLPRRPTFAISLGRFEKDRHTRADGTEERIVFEPDKRNRRHIQVRDVSSISGFILSIIDAAKDWQDSLQGQIPGMHERVVTVRLASDEGGTNLTMPEAVITKLRNYGVMAATSLLDGFDFDEHRYRRAICLLSELEKILPTTTDTIRIHRPEPDAKTFEELARVYQSHHYPNDPEWMLNVLVPALQELADLGEQIKAKSDGSKVSGGLIPDYNARLRLVASPDLTEDSSPRSSVSV